MGFNSEKWALSFYGVVDERFAVETELLNLHIYRKEEIKTIKAERRLGKLDIFIPKDWDMETYHNQEKLRKLMVAEIKWQALNIYQQRTNLIAKRIGLPNIKVSVSTRAIANGRCFYQENRIDYNPWTICYLKSKYVDYLICHELAHFYEHNHLKRFWCKAEQIYLGLDNSDECTGEIIPQIDAERGLSYTVFLLRCWGRPMYLKDFFDSGLVRDKTPLITPCIEDTSEGRVQMGFYTSFEIRFR